LRDRLTGDFESVTVGLLMKPAEYDAYLIHRAIQVIFPFSFKCIIIFLVIFVYVNLLSFVLNKFYFCLYAKCSSFNTIGFVVIYSFSSELKVCFSCTLV